LQPKGGSKLDFSRLIANPDLHLVAWDRLDDQGVHAEGLKLMLDLLDSFGEDVMPLLRPVGRPRGDSHYERGDQSPWADWAGDICGVAENGCLMLCELWVNCSRTKSQLVADALRNWTNIRTGKAACWLRRKLPQDVVFEPLGSPGNNYYENLWREDRMGQVSPIRNKLLPSEQPWLLKVVWYRSTEEVRCLLGPPNDAKFRLNPPLQSDRVRISDLAKDILKPFRPGDYGLLWREGHIDPTDLGISHMPAFAMNAVTAVSQQTIYQLEQYYLARHTTQPHWFADRGEYFRQLADFP